MRARTSHRYTLGCPLSGSDFFSPRVESVSHPVIKGYLVDWDAQKAIWDGIFSDQVLNVSIHAPVTLCSSLLTRQARLTQRRRHFS